MSKFAYLRTRVPREDDPLHKALLESERDVIRAFKEVDAPPILIAKSTLTQSLTPNTLTAVQFDTAVDTAGWWSGSTYTPKEAGFYRCAWNVDLRDAGGAIATSTYGYAQINSELFTFQYGNGVQNDLNVSGSAILDLDGATGVTLYAFLLAGVTTSIFSTSPCRTWLSIDYLGRRALGT